LDKVYLRNIMIRDKLFLLSLFQNKQPSVLINASDLEMNTVIRVIHLIFNNEIELLEENYEALKKSKRLKILMQNFDLEKNFLQTLYLETESKRKLLKKFNSCYPYLFHSIFIKS